MRILVTGGAGFIGSNLCRYLVKDCGDQVLNFDALTYAGRRESLADIAHDPNYQLVTGNINRLDELEACLRQFRPEAILHLAAESHVDRSINAAADFIQTNIVGSFNLLEATRDYWESLPAAARADFRLLHVSTDEVFGSLGATGAFTEETPYDPSSPYSASKAASDHLVRAWGRTYGLPILVTNCSNNYGPFQFPEKLIPLMILNALEGMPLPVYGDGGNRRDWLFVLDHCRALRLVLERGKAYETYGIGGYGQTDSGERSNLELVEQLCAMLDRARPDSSPHRQLIQFVADRPGHDRRYAIDSSKIRRELGWEPAETLNSGLTKTVAWYLENRDWWLPLRKKIYGGERLGLTQGAGR
ncbi:MAG: dTDP-glucose 4,6-dehydratase [Alphaproteobacteria bacterium]|nr:dTDP-glucose 4,6-dehydratase [Alphaproteobacteria bacterium]